MMPKSDSYLKSHLSPIIMRGYSISGENTRPNLYPFLTGFPYSQFRASLGNSCIQNDQLDNCSSFLWSHFARQGYRTSFVEDLVTTSLFNWHWRYAFASPPTDYYPRPFFVQMEQQQSSKLQCIDNRTTFEAILEYVESMAVALNSGKKDSRPYFAFNWATRLAHDDFNTLSLGDEPLLNTLSFLHERNYLNNSALIIMGDHGAWTGQLFQTNQGSLEWRLPLLYIVLPPWFPQKYPQQWKNLQDNQDRLLSPWDLRKTVMQFTDLVDVKQASIRRQEGTTGTGLEAISMLETVASRNRSCSAAGIETQWCYCHGRKEVYVGTRAVKDGVDFVLRSINNVTGSANNSSSLCSPFSLQRILSASELTDLTGDVMIGSLGLDVNFIVNPGGGSFKATIYRRKEASSSAPSSWTLLGRPLRNDRYEGQSDCVKDNKDLQPYCLCLDSEHYKNISTQEGIPS
jgi:hypothetical protein